MERVKEREKEEKVFQRNFVGYENYFLSKERKNPPVLSNLDPILDDEGFYGVKLAIDDNLTTEDLGHNYNSEFHRVTLDENLIEEFEKLLLTGARLFSRFRRP